MVNVFLISLVTSVSALISGGTADKITVALQSGNTTELAAMFNSSIELVTPSTSNVYAKDQAKIVLDNFFKLHAPTKAVLTHQTNGSQSSMLIFDLTTKTGNFRVTVHANTANGGFVINEFKIQ